MRERLLPAAAVLLAAAPLAAQTAQHKHYEKDPAADLPAPTGELAPRLQNLGTHAFPVSTRKPRAQQFVNQGLRLSYGFNHAEAGRAFREAARLDPGLAMAYWGEALVLGPNINVPMAPDDEPRAKAAVEKAVALRARATPRERAYILKQALDAQNRDADAALVEARRAEAWTRADVQLKASRF